ncbi:unnamed protein product, partial [marine sediment metagenome]
MEFDAILLPPRRASSVAQGLWPERTINDALDDCLATCPDKVALSALQVESGETTQLTYRELAGQAGRIAAGLASLGVAGPPQPASRSPACGLALHQRRAPRNLPLPAARCALSCRSRRPARPTCSRARSRRVCTSAA